MASSSGVGFRSLHLFGVPWPEFNDGLVYKDTIKPKDSGKTVIDFYASEYTDSAPREGWLQRISNGQIKINDQLVTHPDTKLSVGTILSYYRVPWNEPEAPYTMEVLFEDEHMVAINKPLGLQVLPGGLFQQRTVLTQLQWRTYGQLPVNLSRNTLDIEQHPVPVHRLGRGTSGVLLCAKSKLAKCVLAAYFADGSLNLKQNRQFTGEDFVARRISKTYRGLTKGIIEEDEVVISQPIGITMYPGVAKGLYVASSSGKPSESRVRVLERDLTRNRTLVQVQISSGRPHQIRIHLSFLGHPLVGDPLYVIGGTPENSILGGGDQGIALDGGFKRPTKPVPGDCGYQLHAYQLVFPHPARDELIEITAPLPNILQSQEERKLFQEGLESNEDSKQSQL